MSFLAPSQRAALVWASKNRRDGKHYFDQSMGRHLGFNLKTAKAMARTGLVDLEETKTGSGTKYWCATLTEDGEKIMRTLIETEETRT